MFAIFAVFTWILALTSLANAVWMLGHAWSWFVVIPGVEDTGAVNAHFIHDVGVAYAVCGLGLIWCLRNLERARPVYLGITAFFAGHALGHVAEILAGTLPPSHWWIDLPLVFSPALILLYFALPGVWRRVADWPQTDSGSSAPPRS